MCIFCGSGSCPPLWEDWHDIICVYSVAPVPVHLCGKIGMILYVYIFCGTGSCPPLWEDWHDIICVYVVAPVLVHLCGKIGMILYHNIYTYNIMPIFPQRWTKTGATEYRHIISCQSSHRGGQEPVPQNICI
jgi:hypothetical protein